MRTLKSKPVFWSHSIPEILGQNHCLLGTPDFPVLTSDKPFLRQPIPQTSSRWREMWSAGKSSHLEPYWVSTSSSTSSFHEAVPGMDLIKRPPTSTAGLALAWPRPHFFQPFQHEFSLEPPRRSLTRPPPFSPCSHTHRQQLPLSS